MKFDDLPVVKDFGKNVVLRKRIIELCSGSMTAQGDAIKRCREDIVFWLNYFGWTYDPRRTDTKVVPFVSYGFQDKAMRRIVEDIREGRDVAILKSRDMGASWINVAVPTWFMLFHPMNSFLMVSRNENYVDAPHDPKSLFWKVRYLMKHVPRWMAPRNVTDHSMHIGNEDNGSVIDGESTTGEVARGDRRTAILMDEFAAFEVKSGYNALASTQSATNCRIFNSTPKGMGNAFYDVVNKSAADVIRMHWAEHPDKAVGLYTSERNEKTGRMELKLIDKAFRGIVSVRDKGAARSRKVAFPEDYPFVLDGKMRSPWYDTQCSRAVTPQEIGQELDMDFLGSDYQFFDTVAVERYKDNFCREPHLVGDVDVLAGGLRFFDNPRGKMSLFEPLVGGGHWQAGRRFVIGVDVSAGTGASNSTMAAYDEATNEKVMEYANPNILPDDFGRLVAGVAKWMNNARIVPDRSGPTGEVMVARLLSEGCTNIYMRRNTKKLGSPVTNEPGVWLTATIRTSILQQYRDGISHCTIINRSARAMDETLRFICKMDGSIEHAASANTNDPGGARSNHGDLVIADALAYLELTEVEAQVEAKDVEAPEDSLAWRMEIRRREEENKNRDELGEAWA